ncbi:NFYB/HAP3 family transcription factor subunit [Candidatus Woesearchaeota archaeon]|nr:NFYB/HAP3 family transcription factor subunit [Candidatus Woesearchaeota archaeon]
MPKKYLPLAAMETLLKKAGAERVADNAKEALKEVLEEKALEISVKAIRFSIHAGRKTVKAGDIKLAVK